jgi:hypothetical protein
MRLLLTAASTLLFLVSTAFGFVDFVPTLAGRHHRSIRTHICPHWLVLQKGNKENFTEGNEANEGFQRFAMPLGPNPQSFVAFCNLPLFYFCRLVAGPLCLHRDGADPGLGKQTPWRRCPFA